MNNIDPQSFFYIALGVGFIILVIFACATMIYLIQILRDVNKVTDSVKDTAERINNYVVQPFAMVSQIVEHVKPLIEGVMRKRSELHEKFQEKSGKSSKKKSKR